MRNIAALFACAVVVACTQGSEAAVRREDTTGRRDSVAAVAAASLTESSALGLLQLTHGADSALGALGAAQGTATEVKEFGRMILREHASLSREVAGIARDIGLAIEKPRVAPDVAPDAMRQTLAATPLGNLWDQAYIGYAIAMHDAAKENTARVLAATRRAEIRAFIERSIPIIEKHRDRATTLQERLAHTTNPAPTTR